MHDVSFLRRKHAAEYLVKTYGFGAERTLAKGVVTGDTPEYHKAGRIVLYTRDALDAWACAKIGKPQHSTSEPTEAPRSHARLTAKPARSSTLAKWKEAGR